VKACGQSQSEEDDGNNISLPVKAMKRLAREIEKRGFL
jgi:hypothetical protein